MPTAMDQPANAMQNVHMGWVNPPADVTSAIEALRQHCEAWPKTPIENPLHLVSGVADAMCQAVAGNAVFVPNNLAEDVFKLGTLMIAAACLLIFFVAGAIGYSVRQWTRHFPPAPKAEKPPPDVLTSLVTVIGFLGWLSAGALVVRYSIGWMEICLLATLLWTFIAPHMVVLLRSKTA